MLAQDVSIMAASNNKKVVDKKTNWLYVVGLSTVIIIYCHCHSPKLVAGSECIGDSLHPSSNRQERLLPARAAVVAKRQAEDSVLVAQVDIGADGNNGRSQVDMEAVGATRIAQPKEEPTDQK